MQATQPVPRRKIFASSFPGHVPSSASSTSSEGWYSSRQWGQLRRTSRWAATSVRALAAMKGSVPIEIRRAAVVGASFAWMVLKTRWPVRAARMATSAVSWSRISPTMITSGSCRRKYRSEVAKVSCLRSLTCTWLMRSIWYSTGSSTVVMFSSSPLSSSRLEYRVVDLPEPVGPDIRIIPYGWWMALRKSA